MKTDCVDFHIHTDLSDGTLSSDQLLSLADSGGISALSFTDHDIAGDWRSQGDVKLVNGIELSIRSLGGDLHLLGYNYNFGDSAIALLIQDLQNKRFARFSKMIEKLALAGLPISINDFPVIRNRSVGRPHVARLLVERGYADSVDDAFSRYLPSSDSYHKISVEEGIRAINEAGGIAVLAHPRSLEMDADEFASFLTYLKKTGLCGIEVYHPMHEDGDISFYGECAESLGLLITGGSDFHDPRTDCAGFYRQGCPIKKELVTRFLERLDID